MFAEAANITQKEAEQRINDIIDFTKMMIDQDYGINIPGFGKFYPKELKPRRFWNENKQEFEFSDFKRIPKCAFTFKLHQRNR